MTFNGNVTPDTVSVDGGGATVSMTLQTNVTRATIYAGEWPNVTTLDSSNVHLNGGIIM